jgi:hypothetical protein
VSKVKFWRILAAIGWAGYLVLLAGVLVFGPGSLDRTPVGQAVAPHDCEIHRAHARVE